MEKERFRGWREIREGGERMKPAEPEARCTPVGVILLARVPIHPLTHPPTHPPTACTGVAVVVVIVEAMHRRERMLPL